MLSLGNNRRLCISGWILFALMLLVLNAVKLIDLESQPLAGHTPAIKNLQMKLVQTNAFSRQKVPETDDPLLFIAATKPLEEDNQLDAGAIPMANNEVSVQETGVLQLPELTGIVEIIDQYSQPSFRAVLDGQVYEKSDRLGRFSIGDVSPEGVLLHHPTGKFFIPNPKPHFSTDQGT